MKIGRNTPCSCGSSLKFKHCCGSAKKSDFTTPLNASLNPPVVAPKIFAERLEARELQRIRQQGLGRPIMSSNHPAGGRVVHVGDSERIPSKAAVFQDFLVDYLGRALGKDWIDAEMRKPFNDRHTIVQWFEIFNRQRKASRRVGEYHMFTGTGASNAFVGLGYSLYLMRHNVDLLALMITRLKARQEFQGAYYEVSIANILIRAGFKLTLEDETDQSSKHCEFAAISNNTGQVYSVECKARSVPGVLHKPIQSASKRQGPLSQIKSHLKLALQKPSKGERLVFIDINTPETRQNPPTWLEDAAGILEDYEKTSTTGKRAFVFVTNMCFHWHLEEANPPMTAFAHGFNVPDFAKPGLITLSQAWRNKRKYVDCYKIGEIIQDFGNIPSTFDGSLPAATLLGQRPPVQIGQTYHFPDVESGVTGKVESAAVIESESCAYISIHTSDNRRLMLKEQMSEHQIADYRTHKETYFGEINRNGESKDEFELYEWFVKTHLEYPREAILGMVKNSPLYGWYESLSHEDLVLSVCEGFIAATREHAPLSV